MQKDLHHAGTYVLCRNAGMKSCYAKIVAYAAQQVDDATYGHALRFENGEVFKQILTAHKGIKFSQLDTNSALEVWMPFHYLPEGITESNPDGLISGPYSVVFDQLLADVLKIGHSPLALYRLGIAMHCYADAFTHQGFKGFYDPINDIFLLIAPEQKSLWNRLKEFFLETITSIVPIGHVQALSNPDIPNAIWSYQKHDGSIVQGNNLHERFWPALQMMYHYLCKYIQENHQFKGNTPMRPFDIYKSKFHSLLTAEGTIETRHENWLEAIQTNMFDWKDFDEIDQTLTYHPNEWFANAVETSKDENFLKQLEYKLFNYCEFCKKDHFLDSDWVKFMRAAAEHKFKVIYDYLPKCNIYIA